MLLKGVKCYFLMNDILYLWIVFLSLNLLKYILKLILIYLFFFIFFKINKCINGYE